jgi:hypothetical protein
VAVSEIMRQEEMDSAYFFDQLPFFSPSLIVSVESRVSGFS